MIAIPNRIACNFALLALLAAGTACQANMVVFEHSTPRHERFANDPAFVGSAAVAGFDLDFSGVARGTNGFWATMVSPTHFVSAAHAPASGSVSFYHSKTRRVPQPCGPSSEVAASVGQISGSAS